MTLEFAADGERLSVTDPIERFVVTLTGDGVLDPAPAAADFTYPVDEAVTVTTRRLTVDRPTALVLDESGASISVVTGGTTETFDAGTYYLQVADDVKTYLRVTARGPLHVDTTTADLTVDFGTPTSVDVGARSIADRPEHAITTTTEPADLLAAVSAFGAALKDTSPMRSFASLRGHPPTLELGDELDIPASLEHPDTGVTIVVPPDPDHIFPIAPLAYYLGATLEAGPDPRIETWTGGVHPLDHPDGYETGVATALKQVFTVDSYARAACPYGTELADHDRFLEDTGIDPDRYVTRSLAERVDRALAIPWQAVDPYVPRWDTDAYVDYTPENVPHLPYLVDDLAIVREPRVVDHDPIGAVAAGEDFTRAAVAGQPAPFADPAFWTDLDPADVVRPDGQLRPAADQATLEAGPDPLLPDAWAVDDTTIVYPEPTAAQHTHWLAAGVPIGASKPTLEAARQALDRDPVDEIEVLVVCNDPRMAAEDEAVRRLLDADTGFDVTVRPYRNLETDALADLLREGADFLHFIGHIDEAGFACPDGHLDARTLDEVNVDACFLNACASATQGRALVDAGAIASIVSLAEIQNGPAARVGTTLARLLDAGFPLGPALDVAGDAHDVDDYTIIGDAAIQVTENPRGAVVLDAETTTDGTWITLRAYATPQAELGSMYAPLVPGLEGWYLTGSDLTTRVPNDDLATYLADSNHPVRIDGRFGWTSDATLP